MLHTELFTQYIANNGGADSALPSLFDKIPSITIDDETTTFKDAFVLNFCDREIGFETEVLFALKLEGRAKLVIPHYVHKLEELSKLDYINAQRSEKETRTTTSKITDGGTDTVTHETSGTSTDGGTDSVTRTTSGTSTDGGTDSVTRTTSGTSTDGGTDTMTHETSGTSTDSGTDTNKRFKGENPLVDTSLDFNAKAVSEQEQNATNYGKTNTTSGSGTDETTYGKTNTTSGNGTDETTYGKTNTTSGNGTDETTYGKTNTTSGSGTDATNYGKTTDNTTTDTLTREYTNDNIEVYELYKRVLDNTVNVWKEIFNEFDSLFMQVW